MTPTPERLPLRAPLRYAAFRALVAGRSLMYFGNGLASVALGFAVLDATGSVVHLGLVLASRSLANVSLLLLGGVLADRLPRPLLLLGACALAAASQGGIAAAVLLGAASLPLLMALSLVNGAAAAANLPAALALTPQTVPAALLRPANALARMGLQLGMVAGMSLGGLIVGLVGAAWALAVDAAAFALAGGCFALVRLPPAAPAAGRGNVLRELREGWSEVASRPWVWIVVVQFMVLNAMVNGGTKILGPVVADDTIGRTAWGVVLAAQTLGALFGGVLAARWQPRRALAFGVALSAAFALPLTVMAAAPTVPLLLAAMFLTGVAVEQFGVAWELSIQQNVPPEKLARVYSYDALGSFVALPLGEACIGPVAALVGTEAALLGAAALVLLATAAALASRSVRTLALA
ncbi:MFS transporter [Marinitenerispora sediminis]|uniref:MFS transporter n=1 Tax=Marinitenerispora sediminis TaxID=1931232 RepID=A0A368T372_9ACTN|nr:MFS transporter [Marinitenerispora sediminis]RCV48646.1 MFS transporter [Marinitenerispora sediminis]RCV50593.1 MFS transporter [Marinitenerispora sediminis]RCV56103.1 MFS transporter [Marinitenerispora sediminis]